MVQAVLDSIRIVPPGTVTTNASMVDYVVSVVTSMCDLGMRIAGPAMLALLLSTVAMIVKLTAPVFAGDTVYAESEVLTKRESASRPTQGIVGVRTRGLKADGTVFMTYDRTVLVPKRGHAVDDKANY